MRAPVNVVVEIIGREGKITVPRFLAATSAELHRYKKRETIRRDFPFPDKQGFECESQEVVDCLNQGQLESDVMPLDETHSIMQTMDAIRKKIGLVYDNDR